MKYAPGTELELAGRPGANGFWQLIAADRGPGIAKSLQRELFKPFTRLQQPEDGISSGLGLSLAKQIVANADGHLWYEDRRSEEHTSALQSLMRISYAVFCLKNKK